MADLLRWRKRNGLTQVEAAAWLGVSQPYLSLLEKGARPLTAELRSRMNVHGRKPDDEVFRTELSALGYPGFAHIERSRRKPRADALILDVLKTANADPRVVAALPWVAREHAEEIDFGWLVRQAKLLDLQNQLGFVLQMSGTTTAEGLSAIHALDRARLLREATLCWDSMPRALREWMRVQRPELAAYWNVLTMLRPEDLHEAA